MILCKAPMALLRILLGVQMFLYGFFGLVSSFEIVAFSKWIPESMEHAVNLTVLTTGLAILAPCLAEIWAFKRLGVHRAKYRIPFLVRMAAKARTPAYAFSGCIWLAIWYFGLWDGRLSSLDFIGPVYIAFVIGLYVSDARTQRRVRSGYEKRRPFLVLY